MSFSYSVYNYFIHFKERTSSFGGMACVNSFGDNMLSDKLLFEALTYTSANMLPLRKSLSSKTWVVDICFVSIFSGFIKDLYGVGVRKFSVTSLPPLGCFPVVITLFGNRWVCR